MFLALSVMQPPFTQQACHEREVISSCSQNPSCNHDKGYVAIGKARGKTFVPECQPLADM